LNLNIKRIIFNQITKFDGVDVDFLNGPTVRQIGGRAGRYKSIYPEGEITTFDREHLPFIREKYFEKPKDILKAGSSKN
jgi:ATP-dependent RNA helicase SUPV3L1/SUV3